MKVPSSPSVTPEFASSPEFEDKFAVLRRAYGARLEVKIAAIEAAWAHYLEAPVGTEKAEALVVSHRLTHSLAGSGATFGFPLISQYARRAEIQLKAILQTLETGAGENAPGDEQRAEIEAAYAQLRQALDQNTKPQTETPAPTKVAAVAASSPGTALGDGAAPVAPVSPVEISPAASANPLIYLFCEGCTEAPGWASSVETFGYRLQMYGEADQLREALRETRPAVLIVNSRAQPTQMGAILGDVWPTLKGEENAQKGEGNAQIPLIWVCENGDLRARLQAVRLGAAAFFTPPIDMDVLLVKLDDLSVLHTPEPFRVLIVEDEPALADFYALTLQEAGMQTREVTDPMELMAPLIDFRPDLILMDVYMPDCQGTELAAVIRQQEAYVGIPIMFLSSEVDTGKQLEAMRLGGDEFLQKPVAKPHLISSVRTRAARARVLQNLMVRDSLTGLLNHTKTKEQLGIEIERRRRLGHPVALAMIDIDHFKTVNDTYGHATGDRVLRSLSRLLSQRMRQTDIVGRYGGEEFAVIMVGADAHNARRAIDEVRQSWANLAHSSNGREFYSTFSAGVSAAPPHEDAASLSESADAALYKAKGAGRNQVILGE